MASMSVSLSDKMRGFIKSRVESGDYHNESEYIRDLVRRDEERHSRDKVILQALHKAEESGVSDRQLPDIIKDVKKRLGKSGKV